MDDNNKKVDLLAYSAYQQHLFTQQIKELNGYETITTFWGDLTIAEAFGVEGIKDTYNNVKKSWYSNYKFWTEFTLCLNHKIWYWWQRNEEFARLYDELWREADNLALNWRGEALEHYVRVTD